MLSSLVMDMATRVQILNEAVSVTYDANTIGKGMNPVFQWATSGTDWALYSWYGNRSGKRKRKTLNLNLSNSAYKLTLGRILLLRRGSYILTLVAAIHYSNDVIQQHNLRVHFIKSQEKINQLM